jgi:hypothetical protein
VRASLSDEGFAPREAVAGLSASWSLFRLVGSPTAALILYLAGVAAVAAFIVGYRTRLAQVAMFVFLASLSARNPWLAGLGPSHLMGSMSFWLLFTDAGSVWSLDWILKHRRAGRVPALGLRLLQWQMALAFFFASVAKWSTWRDGLALHHLLQVSDIVTPFGASLVAWPRLCIALSSLVPWIELTVPVLLIPLAPLAPRWYRAAGIVGGSALFFGVLSCLRVACFAELMISGLALFVMPEWLDRLGLGPRLDERPVEAPVTWDRWLLLGLGAGQLCLVIWSLLTSQRTHRPPSEESLIQRELRQTNLAQRWNMFADVRGYSNIWWSSRGTLRDGSQREILESTVPEVAGQSALPIRWGEVRLKMSKPGTNQLRHLIVNYACREFNRTAGQPLVDLALDLHVQRIADPGQEPAPETVRTFSESCQGLGASGEDRSEQN